MLSHTPGTLLETRSVETIEDKFLQQELQGEEGELPFRYQACELNLMCGSYFDPSLIRLSVKCDYV